jgi:hypothetical protein
MGGAYRSPEPDLSAGAVRKVKEETGLGCRLKLTSSK